MGVVTVLVPDMYGQKSCPNCKGYRPSWYDEMGYQQCTTCNGSNFVTYVTIVTDENLAVDADEVAAQVSPFHAKMLQHASVGYPQRSCGTKVFNLAHNSHGRLRLRCDHCHSGTGMLEVWKARQKPDRNAKLTDAKGGDALAGLMAKLRQERVQLQTT